MFRLRRDQTRGTGRDVDMSTGEPVLLTPSSAEELASILRQASDRKSVVQVVGGRTHSGFGRPTDPEVVVEMSGMAGVEEWDADDLTVTVGGGTRIAELESMLGDRSQTAVLPEHPGEATVGGVVSAGVSSLKRGRLLGTRERMLEVTLVTGDGRIVRAGGRVVKNVTGYDLPRFVVGAFGSLGVIVSICLKLWPTPPATATVQVDSLGTARSVVRPLAVLEADGEVLVFLWGTDAEVDADVDRLQGRAWDGHRWPVDPEGALQWSLRIPPAMTSEAVGHLPDGWRYLAVHGVGEVRAASDSRIGAIELRKWAESVGGSLVVVNAPPAALPGFDPWGSPPPALDLQRRLIHEFDPARILNPGRLPGGL